jgi:hypothetical protein
LKKNCSHAERGFLSFWRGFGEGAGLNNPVTEPKRSQNSKRPLLLFPQPLGYSFSENALSPSQRVSFTDVTCPVFVRLHFPENNNFPMPFQASSSSSLKFA